MAVRQYVGARYVPKFYQNSQNPLSSEWEGNKAYEALTIVTYNNSSYTSKIPVPAGIGNPAQNPTYWVVTGNYNAQVEQYRQTVETAVDTVNTNLQDTQTKLENDLNEYKATTNTALNNETKARTDAIEQEVNARTQADDNINSTIDNLIPKDIEKNRKYVFIADSYGTFHDAQNRNYIEAACDYAGLTKNVDYYETYRVSAGFMPTGNLNFLTVLTDYDSAITNKEEITDVVVLGSANDQADFNGTTLNEHAIAFRDYVRQNYPNATIWVSCFSKGLNRNDYIGNWIYVIDAYQTLTNYGFSFINNSQFVLENLTYLREDYLHPTETGVYVLAYFLGKWIIQRSFDVEYINRGELIKLVPGNDLGLTGTLSFISYQKNGTIYLTAPNTGGIATYGKVTATKEITIPAGLSSAYTNIFGLVNTGYFAKEAPNGDYIHAILLYGSKFADMNIAFTRDHTALTEKSFGTTLQFYNRNAEAITIPAGETQLAILLDSTQVLHI